MLAALPMYDADRSAVEQWWQGLAGHLLRQGLKDVPRSLTWPHDLLAHWQYPDLLLSQTCGYPLTHALHALSGRVQVVGTLAYDAPGCEGIRYRSHLVARQESEGATLADFRGRVLAYNSVGSQSGYHAVRAVVASLAGAERFFLAAKASGSHRASLQLLQQGQADIAAIDCITLAALRRAAPELLTGLHVIGSTAPMPGLPLITAATTSATALSALREGMRQAIVDPALSAVRATLGIIGFEATGRADYQPIVDLAARADALGCHTL